MSEGPGLGGFAIAPDADGWIVGPPPATGHFIDLFGVVRVRDEGAGKARVRIETHRGFANIVGTVHGGFLLAFVDQALFIGPTACGVNVLGGVTVDVSSQFLAPVEVGKPLDAVTEILRETGRMLFVRGMLEQEGERRLAFSGTLRKPGPARG